MPNRLANEQSPYLQQHAENPVEWYPWGEEAFEKARREEKPIFLSIGYSSCHWCHVMEREIFEVQEFADLLNDKYVSIKVDREERPDIDRFYQEVHYLITQRAGGWPTSIFLTHTREPMYAATYIPPEPRYGMPAFDEVCSHIAGEYTVNRENILKGAGEFKMFMEKNKAVMQATEIPEGLEKAILEFSNGAYEKAYGGFGDAPKFPHAAAWQLLMEIVALTGDKTWRENIAFSLKTMAKGGIWDIVEGGFCRYSVDPHWLVPHFEKMTYDNGLLAQVYLQAYHRYADPFFLEIAEMILVFMENRMSENHLFYSASDADSEGEEGKYFVYEYKEVMDELVQLGFDKVGADRICRHFSISPRGHFEGKNIARNESLQKPDFYEKTIGILQKLRESRTYPFIDRKILVSWNAMVIRALFMAGRLKKAYLKKAIDSLDALETKMWKEGSLYHSALIDREPQIEAFLEDYAFLAGAYLEGYKSTLDPDYLIKAERLVAEGAERFHQDGKWYLSRGEFETLAEAQDSSHTSALSEMLDSLLTAGALANSKWIDLARESIVYYMDQGIRYPVYIARLNSCALRIQKDDLIIQSTEENLLKLIPQIDSFNYPYVFLKPDSNTDYRVCGRFQCLETYATESELIHRMKEKG